MRTAGFGRLGLIALDGTKIPANAALPANRIGDRLSAEIDVILAEAAAVDAAEDAAFVADRGSDSVLLVQRRFEASLRANEPAYSDAVQTR